MIENKLKQENNQTEQINAEVIVIVTSKPFLLILKFEEIRLV